MIIFENENAENVFNEIKHKYPLIMAHENDNEKYEITEDMAITMYYHCMSGTLIQIPSRPNVYLPIYKFKMIEEQIKIKNPYDYDH